MSQKPAVSERSICAKPGKDGRPQFDASLTSCRQTDVVKLVVRTEVLPVIFVPGIMGSNLRSNDATKTPVWRLDALFGQPAGLATTMYTKNAGARQKLLHPDRTEVDPDGAVAADARGIGNAKAIRARGWGEVAQTSYGEFLMWLEQTLNPEELNPALWPGYHGDDPRLPWSVVSADGKLKMVPGRRMQMQGQPFAAELKPFEALTTDDLIRRSKLWMPVHAVGYNWLASNQDAAELVLQPAIKRIIRRYNEGAFNCQQVVLVTHSMGGLVARACAQLPGMAKQIAGVVHGVMPAAGAAVAYRRCKIGMADEGDYGAAKVIGYSGKEVTAVFAQAPGALQLLPSKDYPARWLAVSQNGVPPQTWPQSDPYTEIYGVRDKWWGLVKEEWLSPKGGMPITWGIYEKNLSLAKEFHEQLSRKYHPNTYVFYGADEKQRSFERISWKMFPGRGPVHGKRPDFREVLALSPQQVRMDGVTPEYVDGEPQASVLSSPEGGYAESVLGSHWELHCAKQDGSGDGTVPASSGRSPRERGGAHVRQQFGLTGFAHEPAFQDPTAQRATLYAITRIAAGAIAPANGVAAASVSAAPTAPKKAKALR